MFELFSIGFEQILHFNVLLTVFIGVLGGVIAGAIPGFTITMAVVLALPFTFGMEPTQGVATIMGVSIGGLSGGLISAALLGIPGTPSSVATTFDAFPMVKNGQPGKALSIGIWASFFGTLISTVALVTIAPQIAAFAMKIGPWEFFSLIFFSLTIIAGLTGDTIEKGLLAGLFGLALSTVGIDPMTGVSRFTFGLYFLKAGVPFLTVLIGMFAMSRLLTEIEMRSFINDKKNKLDKNYDSKFKLDIFESLMIVLKQPINLFRSSFIGAFIGAVPGAGASISNILAYDQAKKGSKHPEKFGTGIADGIIASESGNNSTAGGGLITTIALGIPGDAVGAVLLSALMIHGVTPGPLLIRNNPEIIGAIYVSLVIASFFMIIIQFFGAKFFVKIVDIPKHVLVPVVLALCLIGSYVLHNRITDLYILLIMGLVGYFLVKYKYPLTPIILGVILGPMAEVNLRRALITDPNPMLFFTRPISLFFILIAVVSVFFSIRQSSKMKKNKA
ncbi:MAG: tripartite tricarboxylate transporter permease [Tissierellales bacterium]|nr:tripartite tricarboxylate transporter permease [Tissierellales bacterium]MBN2827922.1 tripartite tricarboxylate transporter permease [Tissierellales bacterium]